MKHFEVNRTLRGWNITALVFVLDEGVHISIYGGQWAHIGAISIGNLDEACKTIQFPNHKDGVISERWCNAFIHAGYRPVVVEVGIHYEHLDKHGICEVVEVTENMLQTALASLSDAL